jgi:hypothetical protein
MLSSVQFREGAAGLCGKRQLNKGGNDDFGQIQLRVTN